MPAALEKARKEGIPIWQIVEDWLEHQNWDYLAGNDFTIGDIPVAIFARRWFALPIERPAMPRLEAWYDRVKPRPGFIEHIAGPMSDEGSRASRKRDAGAALGFYDRRRSGQAAGQLGGGKRMRKR